MSERETTDDEPTGAEGEDQGSFVQRLHRHFGEDVDPEIDLVDSEESGDGDSSTSLGLVRKLSGHVTLGTRYEVVRQIAQGGMGTIFRVWDGDLRRNLAMKVLHSYRPTDAGSSDPSGYDHEKLGRFLEEAQITGQLDHPGIVPVHELGIDDEGRLFFTMRLVRGRELKEVFDHMRRGEEDMPLTRVLGLLLKVCEAMAYAHSKGVVHRDLKPSNVMVGRFGEVYVMDWGLARVLGSRDTRRSSGERKEKPADASSLSVVRTLRKDESEANPDSPLITMDGDVVGTPSFMAPEQARGQLDEVGPRCDVYSLGCILYYLLSGRAPYVEPGERVSPHTVLNRVLSGPPTPIVKLAEGQAPELIAICEKAMSRDPKRRYADMIQVADDIQAFLENRVVRAYEGGSVAELRKWVSRNRGLAAAVGGLVLLSIGSGIGFVMQKDERIRALADASAKKELLLIDLAQAKELADQRAHEARDALKLAEEREREAADNERRAIANERDARSSVYLANVLAASFSDKLHDVEEMRDRLLDTDPRLREWEWDHLRLRAHPELRDLELDSRLPVDRIRWTRNGATLLALSRDGTLSFLDPTTGNSVREAIGRPFLGAASAPGDAPLELAATPDGTRIAIAGTDGTIRVFDARTGDEVLALPSSGGQGHGARVGALAYGRDGRWLASGADDGSVFLWDSFGSILHRFPRHSGAITDLEWSPDSSRIASACTDGVVRVWDVFLAQDVLALEGHRGAVRCVTWDDGGTRLFAGGDNGLVSQWDARRGTLVSTFSGHIGAILGLDFERRSGRLATASRDRTVRVWDTEEGSCTVLQGHEAAVRDVAFSPDGTQVVSGAEDGSIKVWDPRGDLSVTDLAFHEHRVEAVLFSPDGEYVLTGDENGEVILWEAYSGVPLRRLRDHEKAVTSIAFDGESRSFFTASVDGSVKQYEITEKGSALHRGTFAHDGALTGVLALPGGRILTSCADERIRVFETDTQLLVHEFVGGKRAVLDLELHPDGERFAGRCGDEVGIWPVDGEERLGTLTMRGGAEDCAFSPDGTRLVTGARKGVVLWDVEHEKILHEESDHAGRVRAVAFAPSGKRIASGGDDGKVFIREAETARTLLELDWPGARVATLEFSADGGRLVAGADDGRVRIWETGLRGERRRRWLAQRDLREEVSPIVEGLFDGYFYLRDVLGEIQADTSLDQELRQAAILLANLRGDDPETLHGRSLGDAVLAGGDRERCELALRRAEAALEMQGAAETPGVHLARGAALYRVGRPAEAVAALDLAGTLDRSAERAAVEPLTPAERGIRLLLSAMARRASGDADGARTDFDEAVALLARHPDVASEDPRLVALRAEAEALFEGDA